MNKTIAIVMSLVLISIMGAGILSMNNQTEIINKHELSNNATIFDRTIASCQNGKIGGLNVLDVLTGKATNSYMFDIVVPNGECKNSVILSKDNYTLMQNNVGYFTVVNKASVYAVPTSNWCPLETWIWNGHTGVYNMTKYQKYMLTEYCNIERVSHFNVNLNETMEISDNTTQVVDIPEFGTIAMMILVVSIISIVAVSAKSKVIPRF